MCQLKATSLLEWFSVSRMRSQSFRCDVFDVMICKMMLLSDDVLDYALKRFVMMRFKIFT